MIIASMVNGFVIFVYFRGLDENVAVLCYFLSLGFLVNCRF